MRGALLAWEGGSGRGHIVTLKTVAEAICDRFTFDAALRDLTYQSELAGLCQPVQGPWLPYFGDYRESLGNPYPSTWGEVMGDFGFLRPDILRQSIGWWQDVMRECDISLLIADYAPCALLAARGLGIPSLAVGTGYLVPPSTMESFPVLIPRHSDRIHVESEIIDSINSVLPEFGIPPIRHLPEVYQCTARMAFTLEVLDPYTEWRSEQLLPPIIGGTVEQSSGGDEVFVYLSSREQPDSRLLDAIGSLGIPTRAFIPQLNDDAASRLARQGVVLERSPVAADLISRRSRIIFNAAQHGTVCLGLAAGLPQVSVPSHREQQYNAEAVASLGALRWAGPSERDTDILRSLVLDAYEDSSMAQSAKDFSDVIHPIFLMNTRKIIRRQVTDVIDFMK